MNDEEGNPIIESSFVADRDRWKAEALRLAAALCVAEEALDVWNPPTQAVMLAAASVVSHALAAHDALTADTQ